MFSTRCFYISEQLQRCYDVKVAYPFHCPFSLSFHSLLTNFYTLEVRPCRSQALAIVGLAKRYTALPAGPVALRGHNANKTLNANDPFTPFYPLLPFGFVLWVRVARSFSAGNHYDRHTNNDGDDTANHFIFHRCSSSTPLTHTKAPTHACVNGYRSICARLTSDVNGG